MARSLNRDIVVIDEVSKSDLSSSSVFSSEKAEGPMTVPPDARSFVASLNEPARKSNAQEKDENKTAAQGAVLCSHCGLPVVAARRRAGLTLQFCCSGCETVHEILQHAGLDDYYAFRQRLGEAGRPVDEGKAGAVSEFDSVAFRRLYCQTNPDGSQNVSLLLEGVHCAACVWLVERVGRIEAGVVEARLDISQARLDLRWDPLQVSLGRVAETLRKMGYRARPQRAQEAARRRQAELRALMIRMGVAGAAAGNVMLMAFALYSGAVGIDEAGTMDHQTKRYFEWASLLVSLPALWAAGLFFRGAWASLRTRTPHMDLPIALGILVGFLWGGYGVITGRGELYFDSITALVFFLLVGRYLQRRHQMAASDAAELLHAVLPGEARIEGADGMRVSVSRDDIQEGTRVVVACGEILVVDGAVLSGRSALDKSLISGESDPVTVAPGDRVEAGALNLESELIVEATASGSDTRVARLMAEVNRALSTKTPLTSLADRLAGGFTVAVIVLAVVVGLAWLPTGVEGAIERALSLLIVACPCALGLATPLALSAAVHQAGAAQTFVFAPEALERLGGPLDLVFDKTGTLTEGRLTVVAYEGERDVLGLVAEMEVGARHPVGKAIRSYVEQHNVTRQAPIGATDVREVQGRGLETHVGQDVLRVGSEAFVGARAACGQWPPVPEGLSPVFVARGEAIVGRFVVGDTPRSDAAESLAELKGRGHRLHLLSGDHPETVAAVARQLGRCCGDPDLFVSVTGGVTPEQKLEAIERRQAEAGSRSVAMVGDGINDAGALARADVGIAVSGAAEASRLSAHVYLPKSGLNQVLELVEGSRRTLATIRRGIGFSLVYNAVGITAAACGWLGPLGAAVLMPLSSLTVVSNAYRSRTFGVARSLRVRRSAVDEPRSSARQTT